MCDIFWYITNHGENYVSINYSKLFLKLSETNLSSSDLKKAAGLSGNVISRLRRNQYISLEAAESICKVLNCTLDDIIQLNYDIDDKLTETSSSIKTFSINNRRFLGNKYKLLPFIKHIVAKYCHGINSVVDIFSGTGAVASAFPDCEIITNDLLYSNYLCNVAWFSSEDYDATKLYNLINKYNNLNNLSGNYMTDNFADTYFSYADCAKIGYIREDIEVIFKEGTINQRERALLVCSLIYAMDKIANTCGHYDAYRKGISFEKSLQLLLPLARHDNNPNNQCFNEDANRLALKLNKDLVYIDPPYNSRQYCDAYHLLENVARWEKPVVYGVAKKMNRNGLKSRYCTKSAAEAFDELINNINARYILFSYNNMANKGNGRSNAKISDEQIMKILGGKGNVQVFSEKYKAFTAGKSDIEENEERLFLCTCSNGGNND